MKLFLSFFTLIFLFSHQVAFAEIPTEVNLSANQQEKIYKQVNNLYDDLEIKLSKFDEKTQLKKFKTVQSKISKILEKDVSDKIYFSLFYLNTLLDEKIDILEHNQKIISQVDPNIDLTEKNGNKTFVGFVATWCPHCTSEVPVLDAFYKENKGKVNMQLIVADGKYFDGDFSIPQDLKNSLTYEQVTGQTCGYVPSYVIYDENKKIVEKQCGAKLTKEELTQKLLSKTAGSESGTGVELPTNIGNNLQTETLKDSDIVAFMYTNKGLIKIKLFYEQAPKTVLNFIALSQKGYYNNLTFHRVIKDFMIQGGDPEGTGMGGESIYGEEFEDEFSPQLTNIRGSLSMANSGKNTNGSQFFINQKDNNFLDNRHSVFGQVVEGLENVDKIAGVKVGKNDKPEKDVKIIKIEIKTFQNGSFKNKKIDIETELKKIKEDANKKAKLKEEMNKNRVVKIGDKIKVHYIATLAKNNEKFDSSYDRSEPMEFEVGAKMMIEGFDRGVQGMKVGEKKTIKISPQDGYGERDPKNTQEVPKAQLEEFEKAGIKLEVGEVLPTAYGPLTIVKVTKDTVTVDMNHFLAGEYLLFEVEILEFVD